MKIENHKKIWSAVEYLQLKFQLNLTSNSKTLTSVLIATIDNIRKVGSCSQTSELIETLFKNNFDPRSFHINPQWDIKFKLIHFLSDTKCYVEYCFLGFAVADVEMFIVFGLPPSVQLILANRV